MSSYLNIYIQPKQENVEPIKLISYSRNSKVYQAFYEDIHPTYIGDDDIKYTDLSIDDIDRALYSLNESIDNTSKRLNEYEKHASGNTEIIDSIIELKEYLEELKETSNTINFIRRLVEGASYNLTGFSKVMCNID